MNSLGSKPLDLKLSDTSHHQTSFFCLPSCGAKLKSVTQDFLCTPPHETRTCMSYSHGRKFPCYITYRTFESRLTQKLWPRESAALVVKRFSLCMSPSCASRTYFLFLLYVILLQDKANKRRMLMAIDCRKRLLKSLRSVRYDAFEKVCEQLGITYTFPPQYYRRATRRWLAKKAFCLKVASTSTAYFTSLNISCFIC